MGKEVELSEAEKQLVKVLESAPHPRTLIGGDAFDPVAYMDWYFKDRDAALARAREAKDLALKDRETE